MLAMGSALAGAGVLLVGLLALLFRNPRAPRWTRPEVVVFLSTVPVAGMIGLGAGYALFGVNGLLHGEGSILELLALALVPATVVLIWHALGIKGRLRAYAEVDAGASNVVSLPDPSDEPPQSPAPGRPPHPPGRQAA